MGKGLGRRTAMNDRHEALDRGARNPICVVPKFGKDAP